ncbi:MAG: TraB/GumN family protein [Spirochaetaceae bacterium]|jgi:pheromone shutdown-related protein TraB|nr:TraB/GumN family protein [Spirochaetaceae bacterium]
MSNNHLSIMLQNREIVLLGTAHVSKESIEEVQDLIKSYAASEKGLNMVCIELDSGRLSSMKEKDSWKKLDIVKVLREGKGFLLIANLVLSSFQRRLGSSLGVEPGEEMLNAVDTAQELHIPFALCDREVHITLRRAWARCNLWNKCKLLASLLSSAFSTEKTSEEEIEKLKNGNELDSMMHELAEYLPPVKDTLIDERDRYLAAQIWNSVPAGSGGCQIAVVGAGHLLGIRAHLEKIAGGEKSDVSDLTTIPPPSFIAKCAGALVPALIIILIAAGFFVSGFTVSLTMLVRWILWNGSLAAVGTLLALGHPLSILISFLGAPLATINPFIGVGLFSGITEATVRPPRVDDAQKIASDLTSIKGIYRNRITKALLVFFLSSIGGAIGNIISIPALVQVLVVH